MTAEREVENLERAFRASNSMLACLDAELVLRQVLQSAVEALDANGASIWLRSPESDSLRLAYVYNFPESFIGTDFPLELLGSLADALMQGHAFIEEDLSAWLMASPQLWSCMPLAFDDAMSAVRPVPNIIGAPLWTDGEVSGSIMVSRHAGSRLFSPSDGDNLVLFAEAASTVLHNARLHANLVRELEQRVVERTLQLERARDEVAGKVRQLRAAAEAAARVQDTERRRIAEDLHDRSCQLVAAALYDLQASDDALAKGDVAFACAKIQLAKGLLRGIDEENRKVIQGLRPGVLDRYGLVAAISREVEAHRQRQPGRWEFRRIGVPARLERMQELAVFRIIQEAMQNAAKHALPSRVVVTLSFRPGSLLACVEDDGIGFDPGFAVSTNSRHMGMEILQTRADSIGGQVAIVSRPGAGTCVTLALEMEVAAVQIPAKGQNLPSN